MSKNIEEEKVFAKKYENDEWTNGSGPGSIPTNTVEYRKLLQKIFNDDKYQSYVDIGCGDWQIMKMIDIPKSKKYIGYDIAEKVVQHNQKTYSKDNVEFVYNVDIDQIAPADILIIKDVMIHWPNARIRHFIDNILPKFKYALITEGYWSYTEFSNWDIKDYGEFHNLDLIVSPYNMKNTKILLEYRTKSGWQTNKRMYLYSNPKYMGKLEKIINTLCCQLSVVKHLVVRKFKVRIHYYKQKYLGK